MVGILRFLGISNGLKATTSIKMIEVFMLVGLILCFNDILMQFCIEFVRHKENTAHRRRISNLCSLAVGWKGQCCNFILFEPQSTELTREGPQVSSTILFIGGVHISARVLHVLNLIWFG